jgi:hypothetical protein
VLSAVVCRSGIESDAGNQDAERFREDVLDWLYDLGLSDEIEKRNTNPSHLLWDFAKRKVEPASMRTIGPLAFATIIIMTFAPAVCATSIIAVWMPEKIVIAADSYRRMAGRIKGEAYVQEVLACKIVQADGVYFTSAGLTGDAVSGETVERPIRPVSESDAKLRAKAYKIAELVKQPIIDRVTRILRDEPDLLRRIPEPLQIVLAAVEEGKPVLAIINVKCKQDAKGAVSADVSVDSCLEGCDTGAIYFLGVHDEIDKVIDRTRSNLIWTDPAAYVGKLIELQSKHSRDVKPSVDVLEITAAGARWIYKKGCPE